MRGCGKIFRFFKCIKKAFEFSWKTFISIGWKLTRQPRWESPGIRADGNLASSSLGIFYTVDEILNSPVKSGPVSPESLLVQLGDVIVNFDPWNLSSEDELLVHTLPEKTDIASGTSILGYDLSLSSGQNTFFTPVIVTIPRTVGEDGEWSYVSSELSEDGLNYVASIPHFSLVGEKKVKKYVGTENDIRSTSGDISTQGSLYQYMSFTALDGSFIPMVQRSIYMSDSSFRKLFYTIQTEELKRLLLLAELPSQDAIAFSLGTLNDAQSLADAALSAAGKIRLDGCMAGFGAVLTVDQTFDNSSYWEHEITFSNRTEPLFAPRFVDISVYADEKYSPKPHKDSDLVYECTMYHYLQMG